MSSNYEKLLDYDYAFRLIIVGDYNTGKTTFLNSYIRQERVNTVYDPTIGVDFSSRTIESPCGKTIKLACWDTSGQENFKSIVRSYYRDVCGAFLVFDVTNYRSFSNIPIWLNDICRQSSCRHRHPILLLGTKIDKSNRQVLREDAEKYADENNLVYCEVNALTSENIDGKIQEFIGRILNLDLKNCRGVKPRLSPLDIETSNIDFDKKQEPKSPSDKTCCIIS